MKKHLLLFVVVSGLFISLSAQTIRLVDPIPVIEVDRGENTTLTFTLQNVSKTAKEVMVSRRVSDMAEGHENFFCWEQCFPPFVDQSEGTLTLAAGAEVQDFKMTFMPNGQSGDSYLSYRFYNPDDVSDYVEHKLLIKAREAKPVVAPAKPMLSAPYPNPATEVSFLDYNLPETAKQASLKLFNLIGNEVLQVAVDPAAHTLRIDTRQLGSGVYFVYLQADGQQIATRRLVVSR